MSKHTLRARSSRKSPDPVVKGAYQQTLMVNVLDIPVGMPLDPNPRKPNIDRKKWREIGRHLMNEEGTPNTFHLKNKGITLIAKSVKVTPVVGVKDHDVEIVLNNGDGVGDGGHTYTLITERRAALEDLADNDPEFGQYVQVRVLVGYPPEIVNEIVRGLNTAIQVQEKSLGDHRGDFDWIKDTLKGLPYVSEVSWTEGDAGTLDVLKHILAPMHLFHIGFFPNKGMKHPIKGYISVSAVLDHYLAHKDAYKQMVDILPDILTLHDTIGFEARGLYNQFSGSAGNLTFMEGRKRGKHQFNYIDQESSYRLARSALLPMLASFRWMVEEDPDTGRFRWKDGFNDVLALWRDVAPKLLQQTQSTNTANGRKVHAIGRSSNHWETLHATVGMAYMMLK
jgi:hypothetical protein